jgi:hypothetical protein
VTNFPHNAESCVGHARALLHHKRTINAANQESKAVEHTQYQVLMA